MKRQNILQLRVLPGSPRSRVGGDRAEVSIYRPFFVAGTFTVLTAGCLLGALALLGVARAGSYTASAWTPYVLAHANSQLFGWVGFFVIGFTLQQNPPKRCHSRLFHHLAWLTMMALGVGIALRFAAEPMAASGSPFGRQLGLASSGFQILGISSFLLNFAVTRHRESAFRGWQSIYVYSSFFWLSVVTLIEPLAFWGSHQTDPLASIQFVAEWFAPLRELQFLGFAAMMIFGVALTKLSTCFNAQPSNKALGLAGFGWWTSGVLLRVGGWLWAFHNGLEGPSQRFYFAGSVCLAIGAFYIVASTRVFRKLQPVLQSHKFIRSAFGWLLFACLMLVAEPLVLASVSRPFDHAYTGAIRHAVTVGFISQMILGVGTHVVFRMRDVPDSSMPNLVPTFLLLNIGNALRVGLEVATMYTPSAFLPMGLTGFVELTGLVLWGVVIGTTMFQRVVIVRHAS